MEDSYVLQLLKPKFKDFYLCFCGFAECEPLHSYGPATRPNYILHYVMKGKGIYQVGETKYHLKEGPAFLIEPESLTFYQADKKDPWSYLWVGFGGTEAQRFVRDLGLNSRQLTCECKYGEELKGIVFEMLQHTHSTAENLYYLQGKLYQFFSVLARGIEIQQYADDTKESIYVQEAIAYIKNYYSQKITVEVEPGGERYGPHLLRPAECPCAKLYGQIYAGNAPDKQQRGNIEIHRQVIGADILRRTIVCSRKYRA